MKIRVYTHNTIGEFSCYLCGERYTQNLAAAELVVGNEKKAPVMRDVCPDCLAAGPAGAANRAREYAEELRQLVENLYHRADEVEKIALADWATPEDVEAAAKEIIYKLENNIQFMPPRSNKKE